jgi:hypothetical protein
LGITPCYSAAFLPPAVRVQQQREQSEIKALQSRYVNFGSTFISNPATKDAALKDIIAKQEAHIGGHEAAHKSAAGKFGGSIVIEYDGNGVPVAGHVSVSMPGVDPMNPDASISDNRTVYNAALAPSDPSGQDYAVASQARANEGRAIVFRGQKQRAQQILADGGGMPAIMKAGLDPSLMQRMGIKLPPQGNMQGFPPPMIRGY